MENKKNIDKAFTDHREYIFNVDEIIKMDSGEYSWVVEDFIPGKGITLLSAPAASFKTLLSMELGRCISQGTPFLERATKEKTVLYIDMENNLKVQQLYLKRLGIAHNPQLHIWSQWADKVPPAFPNQLYLDIARKDKPVIIFDSLIAFLGEGVNENVATDIRTVFAFLRSLTNEGATILVLHHAGKSEESQYRGSSDIKGAVDVAYTIKKEEDHVLTLRCFKSRYNFEQDIRVRVVSDEDRLSFKDITVEHASEAAQQEDVKLRVIHSIIADLGKPTQSELVTVVREKFNLSRNPVLELLNRGDNRYWRRENYGKGKAVHYEPIDEGSVNDRYKEVQL